MYQLHYTRSYFFLSLLYQFKTKIKPVTSHQLCTTARGISGPQINEKFLKSVRWKTGSELLVKVTCKNYPFLFSNTLSFLIKPVVSSFAMEFAIGITGQLNISNILPTKSRKELYSQGVQFYKCTLVLRNKRKGHMSVSTGESPFLSFSNKTFIEKTYIR